MHIKTVPVAKRSVYLTCASDIYSRKSLSSRISNTLNASFCVDPTTEAVRLYGSPGIINTDYGSQLLPGAFVAAVTLSEAKLSTDGTGAWTDNIFIERSWRLLKVDKVYLGASNTTRVRNG